MKLIFKIVTMFIASAELSYAVDADDDTGYANPCNDLGTIETLSKLYYDVSHTNGCSDGSPSFHCSGILSHGHDSWLGDGSTESSGYPGIYPAGGPNMTNFSMGTETLASAACPTEIVDDGKYPFWCPTPIAIAEGGISFSYIRRDIALPRKFLDEWNDTGVVSYNANKTEKPIPLWPGPGIMLIPEDYPMVTNGQVDVPSGATSFWNNRVGSSWPFDGASSGRINCGNGFSLAEIMANVDELNALDVPKDILMQCPPTTPDWEEYASIPSGWEDYCPDFDSSDEYYNHLNQTLEEIKAKLNDGYYSPNSTYIIERADMSVSGESPEEISKEIEGFVAGSLETTPTLFACGIKTDQFDSVFIPAMNHENWPEERRDLFQPSAIFTDAFRIETVVRSWQGMGFNQLGKHMVFYADEQEEGSEEKALAYASDFYKASQIGGGTPISIPVVFVNQEELVKDFDATTDTKPNPFRCAATSSSPTEKDATISSTTTINSAAKEEEYTSESSANSAGEEESSSASEKSFLAFYFAMVASVLVVYN